MEFSDAVQTLRIQRNLSKGNNAKAEAIDMAINALYVEKRLKKQYEYMLKSDLSAERNIARILGIILTGEYIND